MIYWIVCLQPCAETQQVVRWSNGKRWLIPNKRGSSWERSITTFLLARPWHNQVKWVVARTNIVSRLIRLYKLHDVGRCFAILTSKRQRRNLEFNVETYWQPVTRFQHIRNVIKFPSNTYRACCAAVCWIDCSFFFFLFKSFREVQKGQSSHYQAVREKMQKSGVL